MNRFLFLFSLVLIFLTGFLFLEWGIIGNSFILLGLGTIAVSVRRFYLGLKPWWGAPLKDIPKYFKKP